MGAGMGAWFLVSFKGYMIDVKVLQEKRCEKPHRTTTNYSDFCFEHWP